MLKLNTISSLQFGPYAKGKAYGEAKYLLASHFDEQYQPTLFKESYVEINSKTERFLLQEGDIILSGKGLRLFAWAYREDFGRVVPSSLFYILKLKTDRILPAYLAHYLNSTRGQFELKQISAGGTLPSIPKKELKQIQIPIPALEEQQRVVQLAGILDKDIQLLEQLLDKKKTLKKGLLNLLLTNQK